MMMIEEENETLDDKRPQQKEVAALEEWRQEEFGRWKDVFPEMKYGEIRKEVAILEKWRQERFDELKKKSPHRSNEKICKIVDDNVLVKGGTKRLRRFLIGEDIKKMSEQLDEGLERNDGIFSGARAKSLQDYKKRKEEIKAEKEAVDNSKPFASIEKNQYRILEKLEEMFLGSFKSSLRVEEQLRLLNHSSLKSQLPLISVLLEMKENSHPARQFAWILGAGTISGLAVGFVLEDEPLFKGSDFLWTNVVLIIFIVGVPLFFLASIFKQSLRSFFRCFWKSLKRLY